MNLVMILSFSIDLASQHVHYETVASRQGHEHVSRGISIVRNCYIATTSKNLKQTET